MKKIIKVIFLLLLILIGITVAQVVKGQSFEGDLFNDGKIRFWLAPDPSYGESIYWENMTSYNTQLIAYVQGTGWTERTVCPFYSGVFIHAESRRGKIIAFTFYKVNDPLSPSSKRMEVLSVGQFIIPLL